MLYIVYLLWLSWNKITSETWIPFIGFEWKLPNLHLYDTWYISNYIHVMSYTYISQIQNKIWVTWHIIYDITSSNVCKFISWWGSYCPPPASRPEGWRCWSWRARWVGGSPWCRSACTRVAAQPIRDEYCSSQPIRGQYYLVQQVLLIEVAVARLLPTNFATQKSGVQCLQIWLCLQVIFCRWLLNPCSIYVWLSLPFWWWPCLWEQGSTQSLFPQTHWITPSRRSGCSPCSQHLRNENRKFLFVLMSLF